VSIGHYADLWDGELLAVPGGASSERVAIKVLRGGITSKPALKDRLKKALEHHSAICAQFRHGNISRFYGFAYNCGVMPALVLEHHANGNIIEYAKQHAVGDDEKLRLVREVAAGMEYLHGFQPAVVHGDIRGANVFINNAGHAVLADYGLVFILESSDFSIQTTGACRWTAPEIINPPEDEEAIDAALGFTLASDVFAFAMTTVEIFDEEPPFADMKNDSSVIFAILEGKRPEIPPAVEKIPILCDLVQRCWSEDPMQRPFAKDVHATLRM